jgi:hypothetical protein
MKTTIHYLDDSQNSLQYVDKNGDTITLNPFSPYYADVATRLSVISVTNSQNAMKRKNYEDAVANAQLSATDLKPYFLPDPPLCEFWPDDPNETGYTVPWNPPLAVVVPGHAAVSTVHGLVNSTIPAAPAAPAATGGSPADFLERLLALLLDHAPALAQMGINIAKNS